MQDKEFAALLIDSYANLQRILTTDNPKEEAEYQLNLVAAKLEAMGIVTTKLDKKNEFVIHIDYIFQGVKSVRGA